MPRFREKVIRLYFGLGCQRPHSALEIAQAFAVSSQVIAELDQIVAAGRPGREALRELRGGAQIFLHPASILAESRSLSQVDSRFQGGTHASAAATPPADRANPHGRAVFIGFRGFKGGVAGYATGGQIKFPAPLFGVLFRAAATWRRATTRRTAFLSYWATGTAHSKNMDLKMLHQLVGFAFVPCSPPKLQR